MTDSAETELDIVSRININLTAIQNVLPVLAAVTVLSPALEANANNVNSLLGNCGTLRLLLDGQRPLTTTTGLKSDQALCDATERVVEILARCFKSCKNGTVDHEKLASIDHRAEMDLSYIDASAVDFVRDLRNQLESIKQTSSADQGTETAAPLLRESQTAIRKTLYELLAMRSSSCSSLHTAMIGLVSGHHDAQHDLSVLVSVCDSAKKDTHCGLHEIRCSVDHGAIDEHSAELCTHFTGRQWHRYTPQWRFNRQRMWQVERQRTCDSNPTIQSLEDLFDTKNRKRFKLAHRKLLQCAVAQALYHFCGTPWIGYPWTSSSLVFRCSDNQKGPFLHSYAQTPLWQTERRVTETDSSPDEEFMLHFTALLLQLERPDMLQDLKFSEEDLGDVEKMDETLNDWIHAMREDDLKKWFVDVLDTCVDFENRRKNVPDPRMIIRDRIWEPLRAELISSFPNIAREVDISLTEEEKLWWPEDEPQAQSGATVECSSKFTTYNNSGHTHSYSSLAANGSGPQVNGAFYGTQINYYGGHRHLDKLPSIGEDGFVV